MDKKQVLLPFEVPYYSQAASPEWIGLILDEHIPAEQDPRWAESGAQSGEEYAWGVPRACGMACVKMVAEAFGGSKRPLMDWVRRGMDRKGYLIEQDPFGDWIEKGWLHQALADVCQAEGLTARACEARIKDFPRWVEQGNCVIASVSFEVGTDLPVTRRGGHLVLITGFELTDGNLSGVIVHNPSGRSKALRINACIPLKRFNQAFTGRVVVVSRADGG